MSSSTESTEQYLSDVALWAHKIREDLGELQRNEGHRAWFRPRSTGVTLVSLLPHSPQLGRGFKSTRGIAKSFEVLFEKWCQARTLGRATPEKKLQSYLIANALTGGRKMSAIDPDLVFLIDELGVPTPSEELELDILSLRPLENGARLASIELKSSRARKELLRQAAAYGEFLDGHRGQLAELASAILGEPVELTEPCERWIVWPGVDGPEPRITEFAEAGVRVVGYSEVDGGFEFQIGPEPRVL